MVQTEASLPVSQGLAGRLRFSRQPAPALATAPFVRMESVLSVPPALAAAMAAATAIPAGQV